MTNDLMRDLIENRIPGHETPKAVWVTITPEVRRWFSPPKPDAYDDWFRQIQADIDRAYENLLMAAMGGVRTTHFSSAWTDYGAQQGLEGLERAHFNEAVGKLAETTKWSHEEAAAMLGKIHHAAERAELDFTAMQQPSPADPRERALRAKQSRGTGPVVPVKERGLVTKYKEKP